MRWERWRILPKVAMMLVEGVPAWTSKSLWYKRKEKEQISYLNSDDEDGK